MSMADEAALAGVTAVYLYEGRVLAHASDFHRSRPGGYTMREAQEYRAKQRLAIEVVRALSSQALFENLDAYDCEQILRKMKGAIHLIQHSPDPTGAPRE
jgi:predicted glycosyltransferase